MAIEAGYLKAERKTDISLTTGISFPVQIPRIAAGMDEQDPAFDPAAFDFLQQAVKAFSRIGRVQRDPVLIFHLPDRLFDFFCIESVPSAEIAVEDQGQF